MQCASVGFDEFGQLMYVITITNTLSICTWAQTRLEIDQKYIVRMQKYNQDEDWISTSPSVEE